MVAFGGCQCGRVRYAVAIDAGEAYLCHCRMCQRATGGVCAALVQVRKDSVTWLQSEPDRFRSSPIATRGFCVACGTPLTYEGDASEHLDLTVGSFDEPGRLHPVGNFGVESRHEAWIDTARLPSKRTDELPNIVAAWRDAGGNLPD